MRCTSCKYFLENTVDPKGECRRHAPRYDNFWPKVSPRDFCGEFTENAKANPPNPPDQGAAPAPLHPVVGQTSEDAQ